MSWSLDKEVLEDGDGTSITRIFLTINGKKAVCPYNGEELGHIISADHGHNAHSVWISFEGSKNGKRLDRNLFDANKGTFANLFSNCSSNASFLEILKKAGVGKRRRQFKTKGKSKPCGRATIPEVVVESRNIETDTFIKDLKIGEYTVSINQLTEPDEQYLCRKIKSSWVETLKEKLRVIPDTVCTIIPVMICPNEISKIEDFKEEDVPLYSFWTLGGNHIVKAIKELNEESENPRISTIRVHVYVALTIKEAIRVGNEHNKSAKTLDWTLQDQILQARKLEERNARSICIMLQEMGCKDNIQTNSMSMMTFAANLCEECFDVLKLLFDAFESVYGPQKSFPSSFIKSLQGLQAGAIMTYLRQALGDVSKLFEIKKEIERSKRMKIIKQVFVNQTDCTDWEEACEVYPDFTCRIDEFADLNFSRKFVPAVILNFCQEAKAGVAAEDIEIELKIKFKGKEIDDSNLINKLKRKITSEVKKSKKWRADISFDSEQ